MKPKQRLITLCLTATLSMTPHLAYATLVGLSPNLPTIDFSGSGTIDYNASSGILTITGQPSTLFSIDPFIFSDILDADENTARSLNITFHVDSNGNLLPNNTNQPDLIIIGAVDTNFDNITDYSGTLLTAKVMQFGYQNGTSSGDDTFDLQLDAIDGALAYLYGGQSLASLVISEVSSAYNSPFNNSFNNNWQGHAKGVIGFLASAVTVPIPPAFWLWAGALGATLSFVRRVKKSHLFSECVV